MHISRFWVNPKWLDGKYKVNLGNKRILYCRKFAHPRIIFVNDYCSQMFRKLQQGHRI